MQLGGGPRCSSLNSKEVEWAHKLGLHLLLEICKQKIMIYLSKMAIPTVDL